MAPAVDVGLPVGALAVMHGHFNDFQPEPCRAKQQVEVAEGVKIAEIFPVRHDAVVIFFEQHFVCAKGIGEFLAEQEAENFSKRPIGDAIGKLHRAFVHFGDQPRAVDELAPAGSDRFVKFRQLFGSDGHIPVVNHQNVAGGSRKSLAECVAFRGTPGSFVRRLEHQFDVALAGVFSNRPLDCFARAVGGAAFDENYFRMASHFRNTLHSRVNVAGFVAAAD